MRNRFTDPASVVAAYDWPINHNEEEESGKVRNVTHTAPTANNVGLVKQQGDDSPFVLKLKGHIKTRAQYAAFWQWFQLCRTQTIYFRDFDNQQYEVQITSFLPTRSRRHSYPAPGLDPHDHYWTYTMELEVYRFISGDLATAGVTP
jgi:hypothetical protein